MCIKVPSGGSVSRAEPSALQVEPLPNGSPSSYGSICMRPLPIEDGAIRTGTFRDLNIICDWDDRCIQQIGRSSREGGTLGR